MSLRKLSSWAGNLGNLISALTAPWSIVLSAVLGATTWVWDSFGNFAGDRSVQVAASVFLATFWTLIGIRWLLNEGRTSTVRVEHDVAYSLCFETVQPIFNPEAELPFALQFSFRNVGSSPIKVRLKSLDIILDDRTLPKSPIPPDLIFVRTAQRGIMSGGFKKKALQDAQSGRISGHATIVVVYGPLKLKDAEIEFQRSLEVKFDINLEIDESGQKLGFGMNNISEIEKDIS
jgi:hypothetical protein